MWNNLDVSFDVVDRLGQAFRIDLGVDFLNLVDESVLLTETLPDLLFEGENSFLCLVTFYAILLLFQH